MVPQNLNTQSGKVVIVRRCIHATQARIYEAHLKNANIPCFISNVATSQMLPFNEGGIALHVREQDLEEVRSIIHQLEMNELNPPESDFRDADMEDILYEQSVYISEKRMRDRIWKYVGLGLIGIIVLICVLLASWHLLNSKVAENTGSIQETKLAYPM